MKTLVMGVVALVILQNSLQAQDEGVRKFGIGTDLELVSAGYYYYDDEDYLVVNLSFYNIFFPITLNQNLRVEPSFGLANSSLSDGAYDVSYTAKQFGLGVLGVRQYGQALIQYGVRSGIVTTSVSVDWEGGDSDSDSKTDFFVGPVVGGEYLFSDHFSVGGEMRIVYTNYGKSKWSHIRTTGHFLVRVYF